MRDGEESLAGRIDYGLLSSFYGPLLTPRQKSMVELYCDEDLSIGEISAQLSVSRQSVHDTLRRAYAKLDEAERKLCLLRRFNEAAGAMKRLRGLLARASVQCPGSEDLPEAVRTLDEYLSKEEQ